MARYVSYKGDNSGRRAINDLIGWFGLSKSKLIFRGVRAAKTFADIDRMDMAISFGGVSGEPVRRLYAHIHTEGVLEEWSSREVGDKEEFEKYKTVPL